MKIRLKKYCILFICLANCSFLCAGYDEHSQENIQKLTRLGYVISGLATASFFCCELSQHNRAARLGKLVQETIKKIDLRPTRTCALYRSPMPEIFLWTCVYQIFKFLEI